MADDVYTKMAREWLMLPENADLWDARPRTLDGRPCRHCRAEIAFYRTRDRKLLPVDVEPVRAADVPPSARWTVDPDALEVHFDPKTEAAWCYVAHFGTCWWSTPKEPANPELAARWRRNRAAMP